MWLQLVFAAQELLCFMANLCLDGDLRVAEPARWRYQLLHVPAGTVATGRRVILPLTNGQSGPTAAT